jgi:transcriptional regulator with XRE-family HTH domain
LAIGELIRSCRTRRRLSQLELALDANLSTKHLSFVETGRSRPSRQLLIHLAQRLDLPIAELNRLLLAGGFAPPYLEPPYERSHSLPPMTYSPTLPMVRSVTTRVPPDL